MENHSKFHGSSHHQADILLFQWLTIITHRLTIDWTIGWCFMVKYQRWLHGIFQPIRGSCPTRRSPETEASQQPPIGFIG
jgi:hypothetical protein